ncbi:MAG TPA: complex I NDUFA9 subunit family protein [Rhodospirillaceae bacterium]|nr:complex I NDUFA9 subunit family protein [Rhodospirillaceae bacterium]MBB58976.1 complex I NDUFA9 subunit family protein [Rhodospirillaceae bacterium]HAJ19926.1 complex I NDUFA9 subunit family protein [Rhodospirillaceae bacterium]HBM13927.1 complex I NDUFA9 subunit family protein [Rhodospirillaceae bacterium]|tara:strand:- start:39498 stop:40448 length:951 start_codon:yes stop_codon:yes gene_type:complete
MVAKVVTVFGGSGFVGRQVVRELARIGCRVRVAVRFPDTASDLKPMGDVGQIVPIACNIRQDSSVARALDGADAVINLVGILYESGTQTFDAVHHQGSARIAKAAKAAGITSFIQMSALGAAPDSPALYARSKAAGEAAVRAEVPEAIVVRPSVIFGPEDSFFNRFASIMRITPLLPLIGGGEQKFQPVYVGDVADAIVKALTDSSAAGRTYELCGPTVYSFKELMELVMSETGRHVGLVPVPFELARIKAFFLELLPVPPLTRDQVELLRSDNIATGNLPGLKDLGIAPTAAEVILPSYLDIYRKGGRYNPAQPV